MKIVFHTLGCKVNQYETQAMRRLLEAEGFETGEFVPGDEAALSADGLVINSCTVTGESDRKLRQLLRRKFALLPQDAQADACAKVHGRLEGSRASARAHMPSIARIRTLFSIWRRYCPASSRPWMYCIVSSSPSCRLMTVASESMARMAAADPL